MLDWKKLILYPLAIYAVIFLFISALVGFKINAQQPWVTLVTMLLSIIGLYLASRAAKVDSFKKALVLGLVWVIVMLTLDFVLTKPFAPYHFKAWTTYVSYALTFLVPTIFAKNK